MKQKFFRNYQLWIERDRKIVYIYLTKNGELFCDI